MKRIFIAGMLTLVILAPVCALADSRMSLMASGLILRHADSGYRDLYGSTTFYPEFILRANVYRQVFVWAGFGFFSGSGKTELLGYGAETSRNIFSLGLGARLGICGKLFVVADAGFCRLGYKEKAMDMEVKGSALGIRVGAGIGLSLTKFLAAEARLGYLSGSDVYEGESFKLGGVQGGLGLEIRFQP